MQTRDHKMLAEFLVAEMGSNIPYLYKKVFIFGSMEPDINLFTYLHGLTRGKKFHGHHYENILLVMRKLFDFLQKEESFGLRKYYCLGKLTHYVADAFTFPHNKEFCGNLKKHCRYESVLHDQFQNILQNQKIMEINRKGIDSFCYIEDLHKEYLREAGTYEIDCRYILQAASMLLGSEKQVVWHTDLIEMKGLPG